MNRVPTLILDPTGGHVVTVGYISGEPGLWPAARVFPLEERRARDAAPRLLLQGSGDTVAPTVDVLLQALVLAAVRNFLQVRVSLAEHTFL
jgi:hypothetical protein